MASRESQGYLIAVIFLTVLLIVFSVISYLMFSRSNEYYDQMQAANEKVKEVEKKSDAYEALSKISFRYIGVNGSLSEVTPLKQQAGADPDVRMQLDELEKSYNTSVAQLIESGDSTVDKKTLINVINKLTDVVGDKHRDVAEQINRNKQIEDDMKKQVAQITAERDKAKQEKVNLQTEFDEAKKTYDSNLTDLRNANAENESKFTAKSQELDKKILEFNNMKKTLTDAKNVAEETARKLKIRIEQLTSTNNSIPDGRVIKVNSLGELVHINLGELDGLRIKQNFTVYDRDETNFETAKPKAKIEVIKISGPHMAVARIHERQVSDPILADDHILSPTWDPGFKVPIAVAGLIDLDGDGKSDLLRFEGLVRQNGGVIVAQHDEKGNRRGDINSNTRFLIVGDTPKGEGAGNVIAAMTFYDKQAKQFNVQRMSVRRFLNLMGVQLRGRVEPLDKFIGTQNKNERFAPRSAFDK